MEPQSVFKIKNAEDRFTLLVDAVKDYAIFLLDPQGYILTWNVGAERIKGYRAKDIIGKHFSIFYPSEFRERKHPEYELKVAAAEGRYEEEGLRIRSDGTEFWAWVTITALKDESGDITGFAKITRDITERKEQEQALRESEERTRLLIEAVKDYAIFMVDTEGRIVSWNSGAQRLTGYTADEVNGKPLSIFYLPDALLKGYPERELQVAREKGHYEEEGLRLRKDGTAYWANVILTPLHDEGGNLRGYAKVTRDITERKKTEDAIRKAHSELELRVEQRTAELLGAVESLQREIQERKKVEAELLKAKEDAQASNMAKSAFLANMSHEIRTPLGAVLGFSELLMQTDISEEERTMCCETLMRNGNLLLTLINDILDLSKVESGKFNVHKTRVNLRDFLEEIAASMNLKADEKGLNFAIIAEGSVPDSIETDPVRLKQIIFNVVGNAIKFTERGSVIVSIKQVNQVRGSSLLAVDVSDTGPGIAPANATKLFSPFMQVDYSLTRKHGGTGLGLALSRHLAQALGGDLKLTESKEEIGSTFTITIDGGFEPSKTILFQSSKSDAANTEREKEKVQPRIPPSLSPSKILVVEDLADNRKLICSYLKRLGAEVDIAENGNEGLIKALDGNYDAILMDLQMPVMDGYEATTELRRLGYSKPIIAITAHAMPEDKEKTMRAGFTGHLTKPVNEQTLFTSLRQLTGT